MKEQRQTNLSKETLLAILDNLPTSIFVKDEQQRFVFCNRQNQMYIGKDPEELYGRSDADFYQGPQLAGFVAADTKVITTGETLIVEEMASPTDGGSIPVLTRKARLKTAEGNVYLIGTNTDLTEIKKREEQYRALAETVPVGVMQIEEDGKVSFANPLMLAMLNSEVAALDLKRVAVLVGRDDGNFPSLADRFECDIGSGEEVRHVLVISSGWLHLKKDNVRSALISVVDISENAELKRINDEILRLNHELADNMKALHEAQDALVKRGRMEQLGQLTATVAHELRNPLGAVRTSAFLIERKLKGKGLGVEGQMLRISNGVARCDAIISQLLDFSRNRALDCKVADLDHWLEGLVSEECHKLPASVEVSCTFGLSGRLVPFDPDRLSRALINMLSNASEAMVGRGDETFKGSGGVPRISIQTREINGSAEIEIADNGLGIPKEIMERIREPLFTTKSFGTGLGIPAIEQIALQHGGTLQIDSVIGEGARFTMCLPLNSANEEAA